MGWDGIQYGIQDGSQNWKTLKFFNYDFTRITMAVEFFFWFNAASIMGVFIFKMNTLLDIKIQEATCGELSVYGDILKGTWGDKMRESLLSYCNFVHYET